MFDTQNNGRVREIMYFLATMLITATLVVSVSIPLVQQTHNLSDLNASESDGDKEGNLVGVDIETFDKVTQDNFNVHLITEAPCDGETCFTVSVLCESLPARTALVKRYSPMPVNGLVRGGVILTTGGPGKGLYGDANDVRAETVSVLREAGFEVFALGWIDKDGWSLAGEGRVGPVCAYAAVVRWIEAELAQEPEVLCAQGNSGGSSQIGYGLSVYGLEDVLDMVIFSAGVTSSDFEVACFGSDDPAREEAEYRGPGTRGVVDAAMGWDGDENYCLKGEYDEQVAKLLDAESIVSSLAVRDFSYPKTKTNFLNSERDSTGSDEQGRIYYEAITTEKAWHEIAGSVHTVDATEEGAAVIRDLFLNECRSY